YYMTQSTSRWGDRPPRKYSQLINDGAADGAGRAYTLQYDVFEAAVMSLLREVNPAEVLGTAAAPDEAQALAGELAGLDAKIGELEGELENGDVAALARALRRLEARKRAVVEKLAEAKQRAASPLSASWGECQTLAEALSAAPDPRDAQL